MANVSAFPLALALTFSHLQPHFLAQAFTALPGLGLHGKGPGWATHLRWVDFGVYTWSTWSNMLTARTLNETSLEKKVVSTNVDNYIYRPYLPVGISRNVRKRLQQSSRKRQAKRPHVNTEHLQDPAQNSHHIWYRNQSHGLTKG